MPHIDPQTLKHVLDTASNILWVGLGGVVINLLTPQKTWEALRGIASRSWKETRVRWLKRSLFEHRYLQSNPHGAIAMCVQEGLLSVLCMVVLMGIKLSIDLGHLSETTERTYTITLGLTLGVGVRTWTSFLSRVDRLTFPQDCERKLLAKLKRLGWEPPQNP